MKCNFKVDDNVCTIKEPRTIYADGVCDGEDRCILFQIYKNLGEWE